MENIIIREIQENEIESSTCALYNFCWFLYEIYKVFYNKNILVDV